MSELPEGWAVIPLGDVFAKTKSVDPSAFPDEEFELYSVPSFSTGAPYIALGATILSNKQTVKPGDVLLCKIVPHINRVWTVGRTKARRQIASGEWIVLRDHPHDPDFLRSCLSDETFRSKFLQTVSGVGGSLMRARPSAVAEIQVPVAPVPEQRRIAAKIDRLSTRSKRALNEVNQADALVKQYRQAILDLAFSGDLSAHFPVQNDGATEYIQTRKRNFCDISISVLHSRDERNSQIKECAETITSLRREFDIPSHWQVSLLGVNFGVYIGATPNRKEAAYWNGSIPWVSSGEVSFCEINKTKESITKNGLRNTSTRLHPVGTVLIAMIGEGKTRGQAAILNIEASNNQNCAAIRVSEAGYDPKYVYYYLMKNYIENRKLGSGNNQQALNKERVQNLPIPIAPPDEAREIVRRIEHAFAAIDRLAAEAMSARKLLDQLDQAVLAKAFRGELVPQDPNDEPASVLLERIRSQRAAAPAPKRGHRKKAAQA